MPNKRNGMYNKRKPRIDLREMYSKDGQSFGFGSKEVSSVVPPRQQEDDENVVHFLLDVFPSVEIEIIQAVVLEYNGELEDCTRKLQEISEGYSNNKMDKKSSTDLAIIACSLLSDESQPTGTSTLDIYDGPDDFSNDLGSGSDALFSDNESCDHIDFSSAPNVQYLSNPDRPSSRKHLNSSAMWGYRNNKSSSVYAEPIDGGKLWLEQNVIGQLENDGSYKGFVDNNKILSQKPDELNNCSKPSNPLNGKIGNKQKNHLLSYLENLTISDNYIDSSLDYRDKQGLKAYVGSGEVYFAHKKETSDKFNSADANKAVIKNIDSFVINGKMKPEASLDLMTTHLNKLNGLHIDPLPKTSSQEWNKFYSSLEPEEVYNSSFSESVKHVGEVEAPTVVRKDGNHLHSSIEASSEQKVSSGVVENVSSSRSHSSRSIDTMKADSCLDKNNEVHSSERIFSLVAANKPKSRVQTPAPTTGQVTSSSSSSSSKDELDGNKKNNSSIGQLSPVTTDFIPRPLASRHSKPIVHGKTSQTTASKQQVLDLTEGLTPVSLGRTLKPKSKTYEGNTTAESSPGLDQFTNSLRSEIVTSSSKKSFSAEKVIDHTDPLGWNDLFSVNTPSQVDPKSERFKKVRRVPKVKLSQKAVPIPVFCPWQTFDVSEVSTPQVSSPRVQFYAWSGNRATSSHYSSASTSSSLYEETDNDSRISDFVTSEGQSSREQQLNGSPFALRLPPSLISKPTPVHTKVNPDPVPNKPPSVTPTKNIDPLIEARPQPSAQSHLIKNKLQLRGVKTPVGIIRRYILEKQPVMVVLRGLPGSGKSYLAKQLIAESQQMGVQGMILSTDDYFMISGQYCFNPLLLPEAHDWNKTRALQCMKESRSPIVIDNTNTTLWELLPYCVLALEHSYDVQLFEPDTAWRMKVAELARKNSHGVRKENIRRMKDRWENFSLDDVLKQASQSIAARKGHVVLPGNVTPVTPSPTRQQNQPTINQQMTNNNQARVAEAEQINTAGHTSYLDLGLDDWFSAPKQVSHTEIKQRERMPKPSNKSPVHGITRDFLSQSLKKAIVSIITMPPAQSADKSTDIAQTAGFIERRKPNNFPRNEIIIKERHLPNESWDSESETPTADMNLSLTEQYSVGSLRHIVQNNNVIAATSEIPSDMLLGLRQREMLDESSVLSNSGSTSGSYHTVPSNSDVSSYHTVDDDADYEDMLHADALAGDGIEDFRFFQQHAHPLLHEPQKGDVDVSNSLETDTELLPVYFEHMSLPSIERQPDESQDSVKAETLHKDQGLDFESIDDQAAQHNSLNPFVKLYSTELSSGTSPFNGPITAASLGGLDSLKESGGDLFTHKIKSDTVRQSKCLPPLSLVGYSSSDDSDTETPVPNSAGLDSLNDLSEIQLNERSELQLNERSEPQLNERSEPQLNERSELQLNDLSEIQLNERSELQLNERSEPQLNERSELQLNERSELQLNDRSELQLNDLSELQLNERPEPQLNDRSELQLNERSEPQLNDLSELQLNDSSAHKENIFDINNGDQMAAADCIQNVTSGTLVREISIDRSTQSSEDYEVSSREISPPPDNQVITSEVQHKKKKTRIRKGRNPGQFIEDSLKTKSKTQNWSSFVVPTSGSSHSSGDSVVLENPIMDTDSSTTQTDPYIFSIVHKLNSPAFNTMQPGEWNLSGVEIITSSSQSSVANRGSKTSVVSVTGVFRKVGGRVDQSTITDETLEKEEVNLETLQNCFPEYTKKQLETTLAICHNDLEWVTNHLLDSPALYDMEDDDDDEEEEGMSAKSAKPEKGSLPIGLLKNAVKSLADICTALVRNTNKVDADDLEMKMIQVGEDRLQKIEMFGRSRLHSFSEDDLGIQDYWADQFERDDFPLHWSTQDFKRRQPSLMQSQTTLFRTSHFLSDLPSSLINNKEFTPQTSALEKAQQSYSSVPERNDLSSSRSAEPRETAAVLEAAGESQLVMPLDFIKNLESLFGPLHLQTENGGFALDDSTARKIHNCLKLQAAKKVWKNSNEQQLKKDEALARALQDEENSGTSSTVNGRSASAGKGKDRHDTVPGWTNQRPSWMAQEKDNVNNVNVSASISGETVRPGSVADTLHQLRGTQRSRVRAHKFQKNMPGSVKSVWYKARLRGQADSLVSIMEEEMAREEQQREQLRIIESTGDMEALATRIKRIELSNLFPSMGPDVLEDIFRSTGFSKEETIRVLWESYNIPPAPMSKEKEDILNQLRKSQQDFHHVDEFYEEDISSVDSGMTYDTLRNEAVFCRQLAADCQQQALRYHSSGMQGAALFYRQRAKKYKENEKAANFKAAQFLFEKGSERLQVENTLDLHFYRLDEAINAVNVAIDMKEDEYRKKPDKRNSYLDIVTGWGRNSKNGKPKLKPAIINHLWTRCFPYEERSPGMLRVYIGKRLVA